MQKLNTLQVWEKYVEGEEVATGPVVENEKKEVLKVLRFDWISLLCVV